jgi:hypothetical protein
MFPRCTSPPIQSNTAVRNTLRWTFILFGTRSKSVMFVCFVDPLPLSSPTSSPRHYRRRHF